MKSLKDLVLEKCNSGKCKKCRKLDKKTLKSIASGEYKPDKKFIDFLNKHVKESVNESEDNEELINNFRNWVQDTIDSWVQSYDDDYDSMEQASVDLDTADDYFSNNFDEFLSEYGYEDANWIDGTFDEIISDYVESTREYLSDTYDHWNNDSW